MIDDLRDISDNGLFEKHFKEIYPEGLELKKGNLFSTKASFLDIGLKIKEKSQRNFLISCILSQFKIVPMAFFDSNISSKIFYSSIGCEMTKEVKRKISKHC